MTGAGHYLSITGGGGDINTIAPEHAGCIVAGAIYALSASPHRRGELNVCVVVVGLQTVRSWMGPMKCGRPYAKRSSTAATGSRCA
jgi:hypothetical protein